MEDDEIEVPDQHWLGIACQRLSEALGLGPEAHSSKCVYTLMISASVRINRLQKELDKIKTEKK
jgi:hypothetical protein